jgi:hypothetical protein
LRIAVWTGDTRDTRPSAELRIFAVEVSPRRARKEGSTSISGALFVFGHSLGLKPESAEFHTGTARLVATEEPFGGTHQDSHWTSPSCVIQNPTATNTRMADIGICRRIPERSADHSKITE